MKRGKLTVRKVKKALEAIRRYAYLCSKIIGRYLLRGMGFYEKES